MGSLQTSSDDQVTAAAVGDPVSSARASGVELLAPLALFQLLLGTTPATSALPIGTPKPTKSILITFVEELDVTLRVAFAECVSEPLVPVIVKG
jgi:hypothetical protein